MQVQMTIFKMDQWPQSWLILALRQDLTASCSHPTEIKHCTMATMNENAG